LRTKARIDRNQPELVKQIRKLGYEVLHVHQLKNCFDILVGARGKNFAFEIKDPSQPPSKRKLTEGEQKFFDKWTGQVNKVETIDEIINIIENE
jgi:Holliday junction resolvase